MNLQKKLISVVLILAMLLSIFYTAKLVKEKEKQDIKRQIEDIARSIDPTYHCVITFDFNFVGK